jgi:uncharacterized protein (DUF58 family)
VRATGARAARNGAAPLRVRPLWSRSAHAGRLATLAAAGLIIAVVTRRPEFAGVAAPALLLLAVRRPPRPAEIGVAVRASATTLAEGEDASLAVSVTGHGDYSVELLLHPRFAVVAGAADGPAAGGGASLPFRVSRSGTRSLGALQVTLRDQWRLSVGQALIELPVISCYPRPAALDSTVVLSRLPSRLGEHASRSAGEGAEFTGIREFIPGDRQRRINWPATTRQGGRLQLNTFAAERTQNVVIIADVTADVGEPGLTPADLALRGAAAAARTYLAARDRVGFIRYLGALRWIAPGLGTRHLYRMLDLMLDGARGVRGGGASGVGVAGPPARGGGITRLPRAALPPGSLILVFSPLLDRRLVEALRDLRERGFSLVIIDVLNAEPGVVSRDRLGAMARRIWRLEQEAIRFSLGELGIPLVRWDGEQSLDEPLAPYTRRVLVSRR